QVIDVEVADAPVANRAFPLQLFEASQRLGQRHIAAPVQQVQVDAVDLQPAPAGVACAPQAGGIGVVGIRSAADTQVTAVHGAAAQGRVHRSTEHTLGTTFTIHLSR